MMELRYNRKIICFAVVIYSVLAGLAILPMEYGAYDDRGSSADGGTDTTVCGSAGSDIPEERDLVQTELLVLWQRR